MSGVAACLQPVLGVCSVDLKPYLPNWTAVAGALLTRLRRGQLQRREFRRTRSILWLQGQWRTKKTRRMFHKMMAAKAAREGRGYKPSKAFKKLRQACTPTISGGGGRGGGGSETTALLPRPRDRSQSASLARSASAQAQGGPGSQAAAAAEDRGVPQGEPYIAWETRGSVVLSRRCKKEPSGKRKESWEPTRKLTFHEVRLQPTSKGFLERAPVGVARNLEMSAADAVPTSSNPRPTWGQEAPADPWRWVASPGLARREYRDELEDVEIGQRRMFPAMFERFALSKGSDVSSGGLLNAMRGGGGSSKEETGVLKAIIRITDHSPAAISSPSGDVRQKTAERAALRAYLTEQEERTTRGGILDEPTVRYEWGRKKLHGRAGTAIHHVNCVCDECCDDWLARLYENHSLLRNYRSGRALVDTAAAPSVARAAAPPQGPRRVDEARNLLSGAGDLASKKGEVVVEVLNVKNWRFGYNETILRELAQSAEGRRIAEGLLPLPEAQLASGMSGPTAPDEPEPEIEPSLQHRDPEPPGTLEVKVFCVRNLRDMELIGKMSPYIKITLADSPKSALLRGQQEQGGEGGSDEEEGGAASEKVKVTRTRWKQGGTCSFGGEALKLQVERDDKCVLIEAWDHDKWKAHDFIGHAAFPLQDFFETFGG